MEIPFYKPSIDGAEIAEVVETLEAGSFTSGVKAKQFEEEFARYVKQEHAVAVNSCTAGLHLAFDAIGLEKGQGVLVPTMSFAATAGVVTYLGAYPLLVDCSAEDYNLDVGDAEQRLQQAVAQGIRVAAILPVHFAGQVGDMHGMRRLARIYRLKIIEDAAHCCPAFYRDQGEASWHMVGKSGDITCFSFSGDKPITTGEGGMVCTRREDYAQRMRMMSRHGLWTGSWKQFGAEGAWEQEVAAPGFKYRMGELPAALGLQQLEKADRLQMMRTRIAGYYEELLSGVEEITLPSVHPDRIHGWHLYVIRLHLDAICLDRSEVMHDLRAAGITTRLHYMPLHMHRYYRETFGYAPEDLPRAARLSREMLSLPCYPEMSFEEVEYVCKQLKQLIMRHRKRIQFPMGAFTVSE